MGLLDDLVGGVADLLGLGGGGGSSVTYGVVSTIQGGDKPVDVVSTLQGGSRPVDVVSTIQGGAKALEVDYGLDDINIDVGGTATPLSTVAELKLPDPITVETDLDVDWAFTRPIVSDITSKIDVEPVQVDLCIDVGLTKLPKACIRQPYESHFGVRILGAELVGFDWSGESNLVIDELPSRPHVEPGGEVHEIPPHPARKRRALGAGPPPHGGLHIRLD